MKKTYVAAQAEVIRFEAKDIITLSGFLGKEISFKSQRRGSQDATVYWNGEE